MMPPYSKYYWNSGRNLIAPLSLGVAQQLHRLWPPADVIKYPRTLSWMLTHAGCLATSIRSAVYQPKWQNVRLPWAIVDRLSKLSLTQADRAILQRQHGKPL
jgi:hypothetical protein